MLESTTLIYYSHEMFLFGSPKLSNGFERKLSDNDGVFFSEVVLRDAKIEWCWALSDPARKIIMRSMTRAVISSKFSLVWQRDTTYEENSLLDLIKNLKLVLYHQISKGNCKSTMI